MTHFGILSRPDIGHLNPMLALASELKKRHHKITFIQIPDNQKQIVSSGFQCKLIGKSKFPLGWLERINSQRGQLTKIEAIRYAVNSYVLPLAKVNLTETPKIIKENRIDVLLIDQLVSEGGTIAEYLTIPFMNVSCMLPLNVEPSVPPPFFPRAYDLSWWAYLRNQCGHFGTRILAKPLKKLINSHRSAWKLPTYSNLNAPYSKLAQLCQQPIDFEFPRRHLPSYFYFSGPLVDPESRESTPFPYERLTEQPMVYASMRTLLNRQLRIFQTIAEACASLDVQLVIALGRTVNLESMPKFAGMPIVVGYAPHLELSLTITHAGLNTTLESLNNGVPIVAIPIGNDQPGVGSRIDWTGVGKVISQEQLTTAKLRTVIQEVLYNEFYHDNARRLQAAIQRDNGVKKAADIIEKVILK